MSSTVQSIVISSRNVAYQLQERLFPRHMIRFAQTSSVNVQQRVACMPCDLGSRPQHLAGFQEADRLIDLTGLH